MDGSVSRWLIADANILIDLVQAGGLDMIRLLTRHQLAEVVMPRCVFDEISQEITETDILKIGIRLLPATIELIAKVGAMEERRLSRQDKTILLLAKENGYAVWTNDKALGKCCKAHGIACFREFAVLKQLARRGFVAKDALLELAQRVEAVNPVMKGVSERLKNEQF